MSSRLAFRLVVAVAMVPWVLPASAAALTDHTWTGGAATRSESSQQWSRDANWSPAPPFGRVGTLTFPKLRAGCAAHCYDAHNDIPGITANAIVLDNAQRAGRVATRYSYDLSGEGITLGAGGLTATTASKRPVDNPYATVPEYVATIDLPITLGASQTWSIDGGPTGTAGLVTELPSGTRDFALTVELERSGWIQLSGIDSEAHGPVSFVGGDAEGGTVVVTESEDGSHAAPINLANNARLATRESQRIGPLRVSASEVAMRSGASLQVLGDVSFDAASTLRPAIDGGGTGRLRATGNIDLGGATLSVVNHGETDGLHACAPPRNGTVYELVTTRGGRVTGAFGNAPDGAVIRAEDCANRPTWMRIDYTPGVVTATVLAPTVTRATEVGTTSATLHGTVDTGGAETTWLFRFGPHRLSRSTRTYTLAAGQSEPVPVTVPLERLTPNTLYWFHLAATNADGTRVSEIRRFHTKPSGSVVLLDRRLQATGGVFSLQLRCKSRRACRGSVGLVYGELACGTGRRVLIKPRGVATLRFRLRPPCLPTVEGKRLVVHFNPKTGQHRLRARIIVTRARSG